MNNYNYNYGANTAGTQAMQYQPVQTYQSPQFFTQPQGSTYFISSSYEIANIPTGSGVSAAICMAEGLLYLKTFQNGKPTLMAYKISPYIQEQNVVTENGENIDSNLFSRLEEKLNSLEEQINLLKRNNGGKINEQLI